MTNYATSDPSVNPAAVPAGYLTGQSTFIVGPDGNLWYSVTTNGQPTIDRFNVQSHTFDERIAVPAAYAIDSLGRWGPTATFTSPGRRTAAATAP